MIKTLLTLFFLLSDAYAENNLQRFRCDYSLIYKTDDVSLFSGSSYCNIKHNECAIIKTPEEVFKEESSNYIRFTTCPGNNISIKLFGHNSALDTDIKTPTCNEDALFLKYEDHYNSDFILDDEMEIPVEINRSCHKTQKETQSDVKNAYSVKITCTTYKPAYVLGSLDDKTINIERLWSELLDNSYNKASGNINELIRAIKKLSSLKITVINNDEYICDGYNLGYKVDDIQKSDDKSLKLIFTKSECIEVKTYKSHDGDYTDYCNKYKETKMTKEYIIE